MNISYNTLTNLLDIQINLECEDELSNKILNLINSHYLEKNNSNKQINCEDYSLKINGSDDSTNFENKLVKLDNLSNKLSYIQEIVFNNNFNCGINFLKHINLKKIIFGYKFNSDFILPNSINEIHFGDEFNSYIFNLPPNLKIIHFGDKFNQPINCLPDSVEIIKLGKKFNQNIKKFPKNLIELYFDSNSVFNSYSDINYSLDNLPPLKRLCLGRTFNQPINYLPNSLEILEFPFQSNFNYPLDNLPSSIKKLTLPYDYSGLLDNLPESIEELVILSSKNKINKFPKSLKYLSINIELVEILNKIDFDNLESLTVIDAGLSNKKFNKLSNPDKIKSIYYHIHYSYKYLNLTWINDNNNTKKYIPINYKNDCSYVILEIIKNKIVEE